MLRNFLKKVPIISLWHKCRRLTLNSQLIEQQLTLAVEEIARLQQESLPNVPYQSSPHKQKIISLTSYGHRVDLVHYTILSLLNQTVRVDKVILWLANEEFSAKTIPQILSDLESELFEVRYCKDIRSYKKLIPALKAFPEAKIVTVDDDVIYPNDHIEKLLEASKNFPNTVICHLAHRIRQRDRKTQAQVNDQPELLPYRQWCNGISQSDPAVDIYPVGVGGVLYPVGSLDDEVLNEAAFTSLCPYADDIWFKLMALKKGTLTKVIDNPRPYKKYLHTPNTQHISLWQINTIQNDIQLANVLSAYPEIQLGNL